MKHSFVVFFLIVPFFFPECFGQAGIDYDLKKPQKFENRQLGSEKTDKKFNVPRRFLQNTVSHYNYYFNANTKINEVVARAKAQNKDDYTQLLPFYNYSLEVTAREKRELDSVIYKTTAGILLHDLRSDWVDNMFMLMAKAYYFRNNLDSAYILFQFINYAFSPKEKEGYDKPIGSNMNESEGGNSMIVSTNEKRNIAKKTFSLPPSRNESLVWQVRTYLAKGMMTEAASLIQTLKHDPLFPERLRTDLFEVQALWFYDAAIYDSAAIYLEKSLDNAVDKIERARWEYLIAQLYEKTGNAAMAQKFYARVFAHTYDPVMEIYARLNYIRQSKGDDADLIQKNIDALNKMARKEIYENYRDIIYYTAAAMELERKNIPGAEAFLLKSAKYAEPNSPQRDRDFLQLGDLSFEQKKYKQAKNYYDSVNVNDQDVIGNVNVFQDRKLALDKIVEQINIIERQDSLQRLAALSPNDRTAYLKKRVKDYFKQQGLKEEEQQYEQNYSFATRNVTPGDAFSTSPTTDWYFSNTTLKGKGFNDFKAKWGNRPNVDNWLLSSQVNRQKSPNSSGVTSQVTITTSADNNKTVVAGPTTYESLLANIPLTPQKMKISQDSIENALFALGKSYEDGLPDYRAAISAYDSLLRRFATTHYREEALFNLYFCYLKLGDQANARRIAALMKGAFPAGKFTQLANDPKGVHNPEMETKNAATHQYEKIYNDFIEGNFTQALAEKKLADSVYGQKYWTPQLLYIESVYQIKQRNDSAAKMNLGTIIQKYSGTPMAERAKTMLDVLNRRQEIEDYLTKLKIERAKDDTVAAAPIAVVKPVDSVQTIPKEDTSLLARLAISKNRAGVLPQKGGNNPSAFDKMNMQAVSMAQLKIDSARTARLRWQMDSLQLAMQRAKSDSVESARLRRQADSLRLSISKLKADSLNLTKHINTINSVFAYKPENPHAVAILMNKVDPVYVSESRNAFIRYNKENYSGKDMEIDNLSLNDTLKLVVINGFDNAADALSYLGKVQKQAPRDIVPWLPVAKYSFLIIDVPNLEMLQSNKDLAAYKKFLAAYYPGQF